jgi:hypothetical protein
MRSSWLRVEVAACEAVDAVAQLGQILLDLL